MEYEATHKYTIRFCPIEVMSAMSWTEFVAVMKEELALFRHAWFTTEFAYDLGWISLTNNNRDVAFGAAEAVQTAMERHKWFKEVLHGY